LFIAGGIIIAFAALSMTTFWISSGRNPAVGVPKAPLEPARSASPPPPVNQDKPIPRTKAVKRAEPKRAVEETRSEATTVTDVPLPGDGPPLYVQSDGDPARAVLERVCTVCHGLRAIEKYSYSSPDGYKELVADMISRGAVLSDEEIATIVEYLFKTYGQK
jgi:mono/diheme cytochrome c family protein